jgi:mono/diheme cytochrome c family protein
MARFMGTALAVIVLIGAAGVAFIYSGIYYIGADRPHWAVTAWLLDQARDRSIDEHAEGIAVPPGLDDQAKIAEGAGLFARNCVACHGAPGVRPGEMANGLYPRPPNLKVVAASESPGELFWVVKHGIKMSGMPAWSAQGDDALWAVVAFLQKLPKMNPQDYQGLLAANRPQGDQQHHAEPGVGSQQPPPSRVEPQPAPRHRR